MEEWATAVRDADPSAPLRVDIFVYPATVDRDDTESCHRRHEGLVGEQRDLCVVFAVREDEKLRLAEFARELARERGATVWRHVR